MKIKCVVLGSCHSGIMFKEKLLGSLINRNIEMTWQHQHDSLVSLMTDPIEADLSNAKSQFQWDFRHFAETCFKKNFFEKLEQYRPDYLIYDTYAESACSIIKVNEHSYLTNNYYLEKSDVMEPFQDCTKLKPDSEEKWQLFQEYAPLFFKELRTRFPDIKIVLVRTRKAEGIREKDGSVRRFSDASAIARENIFRSRYDDFILENVADIRELCMSDDHLPADYETNTFYNYSISGNHYAVSYYGREYSKLQSIIIADLLGGEREYNKYFNQAICIMAKGDFPLLYLQTRIYKDFFRVYIHIEPSEVGRTYTQEQLTLLRDMPNVTLLIRYEIPWGSYNELLVWREMANLAFQNRDIRYVHFTTSEDMPIRPVNQIYDYFDRQADGCSFLNNHADGSREEMKKLADSTYRYYHYFYNANEKDPTVQQQIRDSLAVQKKAGVNRTTIGEFSDLYKGILCGSLTREAYLYCKKYAEQHPEYEQDIKFTRLRTEFFFLTILMNSPDLRQKTVSGIRGGKHGWYWDNNARTYEKVSLESYRKLRQDESFLFIRTVTSKDRELVQQILKDIGSPYKLS